MSGDGRIRGSISTIRALTTGAISIACPVFLELSKWRDNTYLYFLLAIGAAILVSVIDVIFRRLISSMRIIRRILYSNQFIEGRWYDIAYDAAKHKIKEVALIKIGYENEMISVDADLYDDCGKDIGKFTSKFSKYNGRCLEFVHERDTLNKVSDEKFEKEAGKGYSIYNFNRTKRYPVKFTGKFWDQELHSDIEIF
jgi:hypothetical protein